MSKSYQPSQKIVEKYADVFVNFALNGGKGVKRGEVVRISCPDVAEPLYSEIYKAVIRAGAHVIPHYYPAHENRKLHTGRHFLELADDEQLAFYPKEFYRGLAKQIDHNISIIAEVDKEAMKGIDPKKLMKRGQALKQFSNLLRAKENNGTFSWTLGLYGTEAMAKEAGMSLNQYWNQIINACFLRDKNPVKKWQQIQKTIDSYRKKLNRLPIETLHVTGEDVDLIIRLGEKRLFEGGRGANIPSFEIYTSPDWRGTEGWIRFNQPLYRYGNLITGIELWFEKGKVVKAKATKNEKLLKEMIATEGADKVGEFSLTDKRLSNISKFMAETLYDENVGGKYGNTHIALGQSYHNCYDGNPARVTKSGWKKLGFNDSSVHTDIMSTTDRMVVATMADGSEKIIYRNGQFII